MPRTRIDDIYTIPMAAEKLKPLIRLIQNSDFDTIIKNSVEYVLRDKDLIKLEVDRFKSENPEVSNKDLAEFLAKKKVGLATRLGAAAGAAGVIPGVGTGAQIAVSATTAVGEAAYLFYLELRLIFSIAYIYGHDLDDKERVIEAYQVLALHSGIASVSKPYAVRLVGNLAVRTFDKKVSDAFLRKINQKLGANILTKFGTKRGAIAIGRLIPLGVGMSVGALVNKFAITESAKWAIRYYDRVLPGGENLVVYEDGYREAAGQGGIVIDV